MHYSQAEKMEIIENFTLPTDDTYTIEARSYADGSGGPYTLIIESSLVTGTTPMPTQ